MDTRNYGNKELRSIIKYLGNSYKTSKRRIEIIEDTNKVEENYKIYDDDNEFVHTIEKALHACSPQSQIIIRNDYLLDIDASWYKSYFARSSYYRYKNKAIREFLDRLDDYNA